MSGRHFYLNIRHKLAQVLNPGLCLGCGISIKSNRYFCRHCDASLLRVANPCVACGQPNPVTGELCPACLHSPPKWQTMVAPLVYQDATRKFVHQLKFTEQTQLAEALVHHLLPAYRSTRAQVLMPVPLHRSRLLERGFNQSLEIADALSRRLQIPVDRHSLQRVRATDAQSGLSLNQRQQNLARAFHYHQRGQDYHTVAIVDDVITSGSTMTEICKLLLRHGIESIEVWSLARAVLNR